MRTKTLFLTAVLAIAGAASATAQVYSVNAVGYVNVSIPKGFSMIANPLKAADNTIGKLIPTAPAGSLLYKFVPTTGQFATALFDDLDNAWAPASLTLNPGEGAFISAGAAFVNTFVGEVMQGTGANALKTAMPVGFSIVSSQVPQEGALDSVLGFPNSIGGLVYQFDNASGGYKTSIFDDLDNKWSPTPTVKVGESFWVSLTTATTWTREFDINKP